MNRGKCSRLRQKRYSSGIERWIVTLSSTLTPRAPPSAARVSFALAYVSTPSASYTSQCAVTPRRRSRPPSPVHSQPFFLRRDSPYAARPAPAAIDTHFSRLLILRVESSTRASSTFID